MEASAAHSAVAAVVPAVPPRRSPYFLSLMVALMLAVLFAGQSIYYRNQIDTIAAEATRNLPKAPGLARQIFAPINRMSNWLTLGHVREAQRNFLQDLRDSAIRQFTYVRLPDNSVFSMTQQSVAAINELLRDPLGAEAETALNLITRVALSALVRVREHGTWTALQSGMLLFDYMASSGCLSREIIPDYLTWEAKMNDIDDGPLKMRDAEDRVTAPFNRALQKLNTPPGPEGGPLLVPFPTTPSDAQCALARSNFQEALNPLYSFQNDFPTDMPVQVSRWEERIHFDNAMLLLGHAIERGASLPRMGSEFMATCLISVSSPEIPPPAEMYQTYIKLTSSSLTTAWYDVADPETESDPRQRAQLLMVLWRGRNWLHQVRGEPEEKTPPEEITDALKPEEWQAMLNQPPVQLATRIN